MDDSKQLDGNNQTPAKTVNLEEQGVDNNPNLSSEEKQVARDIQTLLETVSDTDTEVVVIAHSQNWNGTLAMGTVGHGTKMWKLSKALKMAIEKLF